MANLLAQNKTKGMNQMFFQAEERLDILLKGLQVEETKVAKCVVKSKKFALQVQTLQTLNRQVDAQRGVSEAFKNFTCEGESAFFKVHKDEVNASTIFVNLSNCVEISK